MNHLILRLSPASLHYLPIRLKIILITLFSTLGLRSSHNKRQNYTVTNFLDNIHRLNFYFKRCFGDGNGDTD
jgi:hypothetical protein